MKNAKSQFFPNSARMSLFSCQPPVALLAVLHLQEGRQGPWGASQGGLAAVVCDQEVLKCLCLMIQQRCWDGSKPGWWK